MLITLMFLSNRVNMNSAFQVGVISIAIAMFAAPCAIAQSTKIGFRCFKHEVKDSYSRTTWNANANYQASKPVNRYSMPSVTPLAPSPMLRQHAGKPWGSNQYYPASSQSYSPNSQYSPSGQSYSPSGQYSPASGQYSPVTNQKRPDDPNWQVGNQNSPLEVTGDYPGQRRLIESEWGSHVEIAQYAHYPSAPQVRTTYVSPKPAWHRDFTNEEIRAKTVWTGANREDRKMQSEIVEKQLRDGPESPDAIKLAWSRAQYFLSAQKPALAEPMLKELIVTLESHAETKENRQILTQARAKLTKLQSIKAKIERQR
jgi:hypothetical protein